MKPAAVLPLAVGLLLAVLLCALAAYGLSTVTYETSFVYAAVSGNLPGGGDWGITFDGHCFQSGYWLAEEHSGNNWSLGDC